MKHFAIPLLSLIALADPLLAGGSGPCTPGFEAGFHPRGATGAVRAQVVFDDGTGPQLFVGGDFDSVGPAHAQRIARFDGTNWSPVTNGADFSGTVYALTVFDFGSGPRLVAGGYFPTVGGVVMNNVCVLENGAWAPLGGGFTLPTGVSGSLNVHAFAIYDAGSGPSLYAAGHFLRASGAPASHVARWTGSAWVDVGGGVNSQVDALRVHDDGSGPKLYAGGQFTTAGGVPARQLARWDGATWSSAGNQEQLGQVLALEVFDEGQGPRLFAAGSFQTFGGAPASRIARWDGTAWSGVGGGLGGNALFTGWVYALHVHDEGAGPELYAGGVLDTAGGAPVVNLARWNGASWSSVGVGLQHLSAGISGGVVLTLSSYAARLHAGGDFSRSGTNVAVDVARFAGSNWEPLAYGEGTDGHVNALLAHDDGAGPALFASGSFRAAGDVPADNIARFSGTGWQPLGAGVTSEVHALAEHDDGSGPALYVGGSFLVTDDHSIAGFARWRNGTWSAVGSATFGIVRAIAQHDDGLGGGPQLYIGGEFFFGSVEGQPCRNVARWDGSAWHVVGNGLGANDSVRALHSFDDGTGPALWAGGAFTSMNNAPFTYRLARWNGGAWSGPGWLDRPVLAFAVHDAGFGPGLHIGGSFVEAAGGVHPTYIARWNGGGWSPLPHAPQNGTSARVESLAAFDDGNGSKLYAGGVFETVAPIIAAPGIARWDGSQWAPVGVGIKGSARAFAAFDDGLAGGPDLYVGGSFSFAGGAPAGGIAVWRGCRASATTYCLGDGSATACPCGNSSALGAGEGCAHSLGTGGGLDVTGAASVSGDSLVLRGSRMPSSTAVYIQGTTQLAGGAGVVFGDGLRCVGGSVIRLGTTVNVGGASRYPTPPQLPVSVRGVVPAGSTRHYQAWFRNAAAFCQLETFNLTSGASVVWGG